MALCLIVCLVLLSVFIINHSNHRSRLSLRLPPGPRGSFFKGIKDLLPKSTPWLTYSEWSKDYESSIISFRVYNRQIIILNDKKSIHDLLDKRAHLYSDRPKSWMFHELCGRGNSVFNIPSTSDRHMKYRRLLQNGLGTRATVGYWPLLEEEIGKLLEGLTKSPENYEKHVRRNAAGVIMKMAYGYSVEREDDFFISVAAEAAQISGWAMAPGRWMVDYYPILRYIPSWFPGARFKRQAEIWRRRLQDLSDVPHDWVKSQMASGKHSESFTSRLLQPDGTKFVNEEQEDIIKWSAGGLYAGATDTTISAILSFVMLMALHPDVQRRAQAEIDETLRAAKSDDGKPKARDLNKLVYLQAVMKEVLRFAPISNLALPHMVVQDDTYAGYHIPKGATIMANVWAVMHDPTTYCNPEIFDPARFIAPNSSMSQTPQPDPRAFAFGFGRRSCPGVQFAETTLLLTMASIIAKFDIKLPLGSGTPKIEFTTAITSHIKLFPVTITPRLLPHYP